MTVPEVYHSPTNDLASHSKFFPTDIHVPHHQLRNFISTVYQDRIYYVHNYDVFVLDIRTQKRSLVATVPFQARCLAAAHGWVCVGGEVKGDCAFVRIGEDESQVGNFGLDLIVDMLGKEIVNSMTIHRMPAARSGLRDEIVVLISNNDRTVTLYSLSQQERLSVLDHAKPMNYATMSPDCALIAAVGDSNEVFFYQRQDVATKQTAATRVYAEYAWLPLATPAIPAGEKVWDDYSFAVAFSPNGRLCAVSASGGAISVFDVPSLLENDRPAEASIICTFRSSRASLLGCVRSMAFSPEPWDLLAWTEDHGKVGIADVRREFTRRQILSLDQSATETIPWTDTTPSEYTGLDVKERLKHQHLQRMRALRGHPPVGARSFEETQQQQVRREMLSYHHGLDLDASERSVLDALETTIDDVEHHVRGPHSINYSESSDVQFPILANDSAREYEIQLLNPDTNVGASHAVPVRRQSVILSESSRARNLPAPETNRDLMTASPVPMSEDNFTPPMSTNDLTPASGVSLSQPMPYNIPPSDPWHIIEATLATDRAREANGFASTRDNPVGLIQVESALFAERRLSDRLERQLADERRLSALLRTEIEARERLLDVRHQEFLLTGQAETRPSPSLERVLQRQLQSEQDNGRQRSNELETEIRSNSQRVDRLLNERELLLSQVRIPSQDAASPSAHTSTLQTTRIHNPDIRELEATLRRMEEERRTRQQRIQDLETQVRRAESRIELASVQNSLERAETNRHHERLLDARFLSAARAGSSAGTLRSLRTAVQEASHASLQSAAGRIRGAAIRRAEAAMNSDRSSAIPRGSELHGRVSASDMRMASIMMQRAAADANTGWSASNGLRSLLGARRVQTPASALESMMTEAGVGTAGIGWSPNGRYLYAGTEAGVFEFKVHIRDRMCFPALDFR